MLRTRISTLLKRTLIAAMAGISVHGLAAAQPLVSVDTAWQRVLFDYFQGDSFAALTQFSLLESQYPESLREIANPGIDPRLLKASLSLTHGLNDEAQQIFSEVLADTQEPAVRTQAWWLLATSWSASGQAKKTADALKQISPALATEHLPAPIVDELVYLRSQLAASGHLDAKEQAPWLQLISEGSLYNTYIGYNQALAQLEQDNARGAIASLVALSQNSVGQDRSNGWRWLSPFTSDDSGILNDERLALNDRIYLTLGYAHLQQHQPSDAIAAFQQVRVDSLDTQAAMLGYGWAASAAGNDAHALSVWESLMNEPRMQGEVFEAFLASAFSYERAGDRAQAFAALERGIARFDAELTALNTERQQITDSWLLQQATHAENERAPVEQVAGLAADVLMQDSVQQQLAALADNQAIAQDLQRWQAQIDVFRVLLTEREQEHHRRIAQARSHAVLDQLSPLKQQRDQLHTEIEDSRDAVFAGHLMDETYLAAKARLGKAAQRFEQIQSDKAGLQQRPLSDKYARRLQRLEGVLKWQASEDYEQRLRLAQKNLQALDEVIEQAEGQQSRLSNLFQQVAPFTLQQARIEALANRIETSLAAQRTLEQQQLARLQRHFSQQFEQHQAQLETYRLQARLAMVRLQDASVRHMQDPDADRLTPKGETDQLPAAAIQEVDSE